MNVRSYEVETLTPCFCAGADQAKAEIRAPSIRGQIRWWFRALGGTAEEEKAVFGGVHGGAKASAVVVRVHTQSWESRPVNLDDLGWRDGRAYLLWPLRPTRDSRQQRGALMPGHRAAFSVAVRRPLDEKLTLRLEQAVEAWILLGAVGTRSRRGLGAMWPVSGSLQPPATLDEFADRVRRLAGGLGGAGPVVLTVAGAARSADEALALMGEWLKQWRAGSQRSVGKPWQWGLNDHDAALGKASRVYRPVIGLPLTQRYSSGAGTYETMVEGASRWASPLHLKVIRCGSGYHPLAVCFKGMAIPEGRRVTVAPASSRGSAHVRQFPVDHDLLNQMLKPTNGGVGILNA